MAWKTQSGNFLKVISRFCGGKDNGNKIYDFWRENGLYGSLLRMSGSMPCTGIKKCVFCGDEDPLEIEKREKKQTELKKEKKKSDL